MKKVTLILILFISLSLFASISDFSFSGVKGRKYIIKSTDSEDFNFISDDLSLDFGYKFFRLGTTFGYTNIPDNFQYIADEELTTEDGEFELSDRFLEIEFSSFRANLGNFDASIGSGIILNAYNNEDIVDGNNKLDGVLTSYSTDNFTVSALYGLSDNNGFSDDDETNNDILIGADFELSHFNNLKLGFSFLQEKFYQTNLDDEYNIKNIFGGRFEYSHDFFDLKTEYAQNERTQLADKDLSGSALYSNLNIYAGKFTFTTAYKKYDRFDDRFNELPTANYSELPIAEYGDSSTPGFDEEGLQLITVYNPTYEDEIIVNYAEGWSSDKNVEQSDFHSEYSHMFAFSTLKFEYSILERMDEQPTTYLWEKESKQKIAYDFIVKEMPILLKAEFETTDKDGYGVTSVEYEPSIQTDFSWKDYSISILTTHLFHDKNDVSEESPKIGVEFTTNLFDNTDVKLFVGSEKGGQVCRNGVCNYQAPFEGFRLELSTKF